MVDISRDKEEEQLDGESSDNEDDDEYVFESQGLLRMFTDNLSFSRLYWLNSNVDNIYF